MHGKKANSTRSSRTKKEEEQPWSRDSVNENMVETDGERRWREHGNFAVRPGERGRGRRTAVCAAGQLKHLKWRDRCHNERRRLTKRANLRWVTTTVTSSSRLCSSSLFSKDARVAWVCGGAGTVAPSMAKEFKLARTPEFHVTHTDLGGRAN